MPSPPVGRRAQRSCGGSRAAPWAAKEYVSAAQVLAELSDILVSDLARRGGFCRVGADGATDNATCDRLSVHPEGASG
ncbi:hypothetical protein [Pseudophaeobacter sp.]|uniref:hypothetical protein n=1 Tax=Pseudophaeobacter sp. TaxID=1971739 RepID=UPI00262F4B3E|nr:hypothetical protein [Pseudophaeobacter sp.]